MVNFRPSLICLAVVALVAAVCNANKVMLNGKATYYTVSS